jgi:hypothetical protein
MGFIALSFDDGRIDGILDGGCKWFVLESGKFVKDCFGSPGGLASGGGSR